MMIDFQIYFGAEQVHGDSLTSINDGYVLQSLT